MADATWTVSEDEWRTAFNGIRMTAKAHGLDVNHADVHSFILHQSDVTASLYAQARFLNNIIHEE